MSADKNVPVCWPDLAEPLLMLFRETTASAVLHLLSAQIEFSGEKKKNYRWNFLCVVVSQKTLTSMCKFGILTDERIICSFSNGCTEIQSSDVILFLKLFHMFHTWVVQIAKTISQLSCLPHSRFF